jgi:hypothetical protein
MCNGTTRGSWRQEVLLRCSASELFHPWSLILRHFCFPARLQIAQFIFFAAKMADRDRITVWSDPEQNREFLCHCFICLMLWAIGGILCFVILRMDKLYESSSLDESAAPSISPTASSFYY